MTLFFHCVFGESLPFKLAEKFGQRVELQALEFINALPVDWRLCADSGPVSAWQGSLPVRRTLAFHDLQAPSRSGGTLGLPAAGLWLETRGIGEGSVAIWLRDETFHAPLIQPVPVVRLSGITQRQ